MEPLTIVTDDYLDDHAEQMAAHEELQRHFQQCQEFINACQDISAELQQAEFHFYNERLDEGKDSIERAGLELGTLIQAVKTYRRSGP